MAGELLGGKANGGGKEHNFMDEWQQWNNLLVFGTEQCSEESYFNTLKITEDTVRMKRTGHFEFAYRVFIDWARREEEV
jgi:hypothetical protein